MLYGPISPATQTSTATALVVAVADGNSQAKEELGLNDCGGPCRAAVADGNKEESFFGACWCLMSKAIPTALALAATTLSNTLAFSFVGRYSSEASQAAHGLGYSVGNMLCLMIGFGLVGGLDSLCPQAIGRQQKWRCWAYLYQAIAVVFAVLAIAAPLLWWSGPLLTTMNQDPQFARHVQQYLRCAVPGLAGLCVFEALRKFLVYHGRIRAQNVVSMCSIATQAVALWFFVGRLGWGAEGAGVARSLTAAAAVLLLIGYVALSRNSMGWKEFQDWRWGRQAQRYGGSEAGGGCSRSCVNGKQINLAASSNGSTAVAIADDCNDIPRVHPMPVIYSEASYTAASSSALNRPRSLIEPAETAAIIASTNLPQTPLSQYLCRPLTAVSSECCTQQPASLDDIAPIASERRRDVNPADALVVDRRGRGGQTPAAPTHARGRAQWSRNSSGIAAVQEPGTTSNLCKLPPPANSEEAEEDSDRSSASRGIQSPLMCARQQNSASSRRQQQQQQHTGTANEGNRRQRGSCELVAAAELRLWSGLWSYIRLALPAALMCAAEWISYEAMVVEATVLGSADLAALSTAQALASLCFVASSALALQTTSEVGRALGRGDGETAKRFASAGLLCAGILPCGYAALILAAPQLVAELFSNSPQVQRVFLRNLPLLAILVALDCVHVCVCGVLKALGLAWYGAVFDIIGLLGIMQLSGLIFAFPGKMRSAGFVLGGIVGVGVSAAAGLCFIYANADWAEAVGRARQQTENEQGEEKNRPQCGMLDSGKCHRESSPGNARAAASSTMSTMAGTVSLL